jgi:hypothetical protein
MEAGRTPPGSRISALIDLLVGHPIATDEEDEHKIGVVEGVPMLGLDALASSSCTAPKRP